MAEQTHRPRKQCRGINPEPGFLALEFESFLNTTFDGDPPAEKTVQYEQLEYAFYAGALKVMEPEADQFAMAGEVIAFLQGKKQALERLALEQSPEQDEAAQ